MAASMPALSVFTKPPVRSHCRRLLHGQVGNGLTKLTPLPGRCLSSMKTGSEVIVTKLASPYQGMTVFSINRPEVRNAINFDVLHQFRQAIEDADNDPGTKVVIVKGESPRMFCAGADLKERHVLCDDDYKRWSWTIRRMTSELAELRHPTVAAIDGPAIGGGLELALACDIRIAASNVKLGVPETTLAIIPGAGGSQRLPRIVGATFAKELIYTGRILDAQTARDRYKLVHFVVQQNDEGASAYEYALELALSHIHMCFQATNLGMTDGRSSLHDAYLTANVPECNAKT